MKKLRIPLLFLLAIGCASTRPQAVSEERLATPELVVRPPSPEDFAGATPPPQVAGNAQATMKIFYGDDSYCCGVRVADALILSSAHCYIGFNGDEPLEKSEPHRIKRNGQEHRLEVAELGNWAPPEGKMDDWILFSPIGGTGVLDGIPVVAFPDKAEWDAILANRGRFGAADRGAPIWHISFLGLPIRRMYPRPVFVDPNEPFFSKGFIKSERAYKKNTLFILLRNQFYDDLLSGSYPNFEVDVDAEWEKLPAMKEPKSAKHVYMWLQRWSDAVDRVLYHTADYFLFSCGGGHYSEDTGHYLGFVTANAAIVNPENTFTGGSGLLLYRIDQVCEQSALLSKLEKCRLLVGVKRGG